MNIFDGYEIESETEQLLRIFREGADRLEMGMNFEECAREASDFVYDLDEPTKGLVVIDLLVLASTLESEVTELRLREMEL